MLDECSEKSKYGQIMTSVVVDEFKRGSLYF